MESAVTAPVSGHIKRVLIQEGVWFCIVLGLLFECVSRRLAQPGRSCGRDRSLKTHIPRPVCTVEERRIQPVLFTLCPRLSRRGSTIECYTASLVSEFPTEVVASVSARMIPPDAGCISHQPHTLIDGRPLSGHGSVPRMR